MIICTGGDHEYSIFDSVHDHDLWTEPRDDCELHDAELMVSLAGHRGHYLGRDFIYEAMELLNVPDTSNSEFRDMQILDRYEDEYDVEIEPGLTIAECISEMVGEYESRLDEAGYLTEWDDGVMIVKVGEQINE